MKKACVITTLLGLVLFTAGSVAAENVFIYPNAGQSQEQQEKDKSECYHWAKGQSNFDPMASPTATTPPPVTEAPTAGVGRGAAGGALAGLAIGAIAGNAGKGAAIGAVSGGLFGGMRRHNQVASQQQQEQQWEQQQAAQYQQGRNSYNRAYKACLEGRKYTVK